MRPLDPVTKDWVQLALDTLTALGTLGAVIAAVWLAHRERNEVVRARAGERSIIGLGPRGEQSKDVINIEVTNLTSRSIEPVGPSQNFTPLDLSTPNPVCCFCNGATCTARSEAMPIF